MKKKTYKKNESKSEYDPQRHQNVLLEEIRRDVKIVTEGHGGLARSMDEVKETLKGHESRFDRIEMVVSENRKDIKELKSAVKRIDQKLDTVTTNHEQRIQKLETVR